MVRVFNKIIISIFLIIATVFTAQPNVCAVRYIDGRFPTNRQFRAIMAKKVRGKGICRNFSRHAHEPVSPDTSKILLVAINSYRSDITESFNVMVPIITVKGEFVQCVSFDIDFKPEMPTAETVKMLFYSNECKEADFTWEYDSPVGGGYGDFKPRPFPDCWSEYSDLKIEDYQKEGFIEELIRAHSANDRGDSTHGYLTRMRLAYVKFFRIAPNEIVPVPVRYYAS